MSFTLIKKQWYWIVLALFIFVYVLTLSRLSILRHNAFASGLDLGNMDQTVWNTLQGRPFSLTYEGVNQLRFAAHADFFLLLLAPFYLIWNSPHMLNVVESMYLGLGAVPVFLIARKLLADRKLALLFSLMYLLSPVVEWIDVFDYHAVSFAVPALLAVFYCVLVKKWRWYALFIGLALITKEHIGLQVAVLGIVVATVFREKKIGGITFLVGILWSVIMIFLVLPQFSSSGQHWAFAWYDFSANLVHRFFFDPEIRAYYALLLKSFGFLPWLGLPWLILTAPDLAINVLSSHPEMHSIKYHYTSGLVPGLMLSSIYGLWYVRKTFKNPLVSYVVMLGALFIVVRVNYHHSPLPTTESCWCQSYEVSQDDVEFEKVLQRIPESATVTSSTELHAHVTHREFAYMLPHATQSADFIALIDQHRVIDNYGPKEYEKDLVEKLHEEGRYDLVEHIGHFYLYKKTE